MKIVAKKFTHIEKRSPTRSATRKQAGVHTKIGTYW